MAPNQRTLRFLLFAAVLSSLFLFVYALFQFSINKNEIHSREVKPSAVYNGAARNSFQMTQRLESLQSDLSVVKSSRTEDAEGTRQLKIANKNHEVPHTHADVDSSSYETLSPVFEDADHHHDDSKVASDLKKSIRILCWVMTSPDNHKSRAIHVMKTWGKRCTKLLFVSEGSDADLPVVEVKVKHGREHLTAKTIGAFDHLYEHHINDADWFMKADDDTYVILENLRYFLSSQDPNEPIYFGHHFHVIVQPQGYFSGGAGYVLSREALRRFGGRSLGKCQEDGGAEDVVMGTCMQALGVEAGDSRDSLNRSRFHCFDPVTHMDGHYPSWYLQYDKYGAKSGAETISDYAISFHYVDVPQMYRLEFFLYHLRPYGIGSGQQDLNRHPKRLPTSNLIAIVTAKPTSSSLN